MCFLELCMHLKLYTLSNTCKYHTEIHEIKDLANVLEGVKQLQPLLYAVRRLQLKANDTTTEKRSPEPPPKAHPLKKAVLTGEEVTSKKFSRLS